jgi:Methyltransferase domain
MLTNLSNIDVFAGHVTARLNAIYALRLYHPISTLAHSLRRRSRSFRGKASRHEQPTSLPKVAWSDVFHQQKVSVIETAKRSGNVTLNELAILAEAAAGIPNGTEVLEIGTFDGRTTINLALNAPARSLIFTLDLLPNQPTQIQLEHGERQYVEKPMPGTRFSHNRRSIPELTERITQLFGDSATFDWSDHYGKVGLVFVDGSHAYDYVRVDSATAMRLAAINGVVLWHDYGVWEGVTRALEDLEATKNLGLQHIRGTSLVCWRRQM